MTWLPNYPKRKLYRSEKELAEKYYGYEYNAEEDAYGYFCNTASFYDWYSIGGRWPRVFLVPETCTEYSLGHYEGDEEDAKGPEGYRWVAAARKKDIAWDAMTKLYMDAQAESYLKLKQAYETKTLPEKSGLSFRENGINGILRVLYIDGERVWRPSATGTASRRTPNTSSPPAAIWLRTAITTLATCSTVPRT